MVHGNDEGADRLAEIRQQVESVKTVRFVSETKIRKFYSFVVLKSCWMNVYFRVLKMPFAEFTWMNILNYMSFPATTDVFSLQFMLFQVMSNNMQRVLERGERLDNIEGRTEALTQSVCFLCSAVRREVVPFFAELFYSNFWCICSEMLRIFFSGD